MANSLPVSYNFLDLCTTTGKLLLILPVSCSLVTFILSAKLSSFHLAPSSAPFFCVHWCPFQFAITSLSASSLGGDPLFWQTTVAVMSGSACSRRCTLQTASFIGAFKKREELSHVIQTFCSYKRNDHLLEKSISAVSLQVKNC